MNRICFGKRWFAIIGLSAAVGWLLLQAKNGEKKEIRGDERAPRTQVEGGAGVAFQFRSEAALVGFAVPGDVSHIPSKDEFCSDIEEALQNQIVTSPDEEAGTALLKRIVNGLKNEVRTSLDSGESVEATYSRMVARQKMEAEYRLSLLEKVCRGVRSIDEVNPTLKMMGMAEISKNELGGLTGVSNFWYITR